MRTAGHAVLFSGATVAIGLACLVLIPLPFIRSMGIGGLLIPLVSILAAMTLLPALLAMFGSSLLRLRVPLIGLRPDGEGGVWARIAEVIMRRPALVAGLTGGFLVLCALPAPFLSLTPGSSKACPRRSRRFRASSCSSARSGRGRSHRWSRSSTAGAPAASAGRAAPSAGSSASCAPIRKSRSSSRRPARAPTYLPPDPPAATRESSSRRGTTTAPTRPRSWRAASAHIYVPEARFGSARVYAGGGPPAGVDFIDRAYGVFPWLVLGVLGSPIWC